MADWWEADPVADQGAPPQQSAGGNWWDADPVAEPEKLPQQAAREGNWWQADPTVEQHEAQIRQQAIPTTQWGGDKQAPKEPEAEGTIGTALRSAAHAVLPSAAGLAGIPAGVAAGAALGLPAAGWGAIPGAIVGGIGGYIAGSKAQETALQAMGFDDSQQMAVNTKTNPKSALAGEVLGALPTVGVGAGAQLATRVGGALGGGLLEAGSQALGGEELDPTRIGGAALAGGLLTKPTRLGEAIGGGAARAIGRPELWHGTAGSDAAAGTAKEQPPPSVTSGEQPVNDSRYAKEPRVTEVEAQPPAAAQPPPQVIPGEAPAAAQATAPRVTEVDPALDAAVNKRPIEPRVTEGEAPPVAERGPGPQVTEEPTQYGQLLDKEFPRVPQPQVFEGEAPAAAARGPEPRVTPVEEPVMENLAPQIPREAMAQRAPDETYGDVLRRLAADERGGGRIGGPRKPPIEEPGAGPVAEATEEALPPSELPTATQVRRMSRQQLTDLAHEIGVGERKIASSKTVSNLSRHVLDRVEEINKNRAVVEVSSAAAEARVDEIARQIEVDKARAATPKATAQEAVAEPGAGPVAKGTVHVVHENGVPLGNLHNNGFVNPADAAEMVARRSELFPDRKYEVREMSGRDASKAMNENSARIAAEAEARMKGKQPPATPTAEVMPTPRVMEGEAVPGAAAKIDESLKARGFTPEQIAKMKPKAKEAILQKREGEIGAGPPAAAPAETLDPKLANRMLNQPAILKSEAAKRGITPEALKAQATEALKTAPAAPLPGKPAQMSPVGGQAPATVPLGKGVPTATQAAAAAKARIAARKGQPVPATPAATPAAAPPGKPPKPPSVGQAAAAAGGAPPPPPSGPASMVYAPRQKRSDLNDLWRSVKLLVGGDIGPLGRQATASIRKSYGENTRVYEQGQALLERHREQVFNTSEADRWKINDKIENGVTTKNWQPSPEQQTLINDTKSVMDHWKEQLQGLDRTKQMDFVENYLPHMYENPDTARDFFNSWGKRGGAGSTKKRTMPTYQDAIDAGLKPLTSDPIELAQRYGLSMKHFIASNDVIERAVDTGVAGYFKAGKSIGASGSPSPLQVGGPPPGWKRLNAPPNARGHELYAPEDFADKYNAFYNKGFFGGSHAPIYNAARNANSAWTSLELGLNPYHFFTMVNEAMITDIAKGFDQMFSGQFKKGMGSIINSPIAGRTRYVEGKNFQQEYLNPNSTDPIASVVAEANARPIGKGHALDVLGSPNDPRTPVRGSFLKNFSSENINFEVRKAVEEFKQDFEKAGTSYERVKFAGKQMSRMLQTVGAPIFDKYIPALKAGALHSHMEAWFDANSHIDPQNMTPEQRQLAVQAAIKFTDTIDNRFGEMIHDNTFMNKTMQQAATVLMRSFSWTVGAMREIAGGSIAGAKAFSALGRGENKFSMRHPEYDPRIAYVAALGAGVSITSAIYQYLHTGELPQDINDLYAPKTGGTVPGLGGKGEVPEHVLMPGFHKDVYGWLTHPLSEAYAKGSGLATTGYEQLTNEDWRGDPIYKRGADPIDHMTQRASHLFGRFGPISIKNMIKGQPDTSGISATETALGFRAPGAAIQDPKQLENWMRVKSEREWEAKQRHERTAAKKYEPRAVQ